MRRLAFFIVLLAAAGLEAAEIKAVRSWAAPDRTRVVFDVSAAVEYHVFTMRNPDRVVIDFRDARTRRPLVLPGKDGSRVRRLRHAERGDGGLRVVLDLTRGHEVRDSLLAPNDQYGHRVVLDLLGQSHPAVAEERPAPAPQPRPVAAAPAPALRDIVVAIDAGHGGEDVGAIGPSGVYEKDIVMAVAKALAERIDRQPGMRAILTREGDYYLKLRTRMDRARARRADLFVSIHADAFRDRRVQGSSVYVLSQRGASSEAAKWLADNENASDLVGGVTLDDKDAVLKSVLLDLSQTASIEASIDAANHVLESLKKLGKVHKRRVQHAGFMVLKSPDIPSILVETAFISNPSEESRLRSRVYREKLADALLHGIVDYFSSNPPPATRFAANRSHRVVRGETLSGIANRYAVSINSIKLANDLEREMVQAGEVLRIP